MALHGLNMYIYQSNILKHPKTSASGSICQSDGQGSFVEPMLSIALTVTKRNLCHSGAPSAADVRRSDVGVDTGETPKGLSPMHLAHC